MVRWIFIFVMLLLPFHAMAQEKPAASAPPVVEAAPETPSADTATPSPDSTETTPAADKKTINLRALRPLLLTYLEHVAVEQAKSYRGLVRTPTEGELGQSLLTQAEKIKPPPEEREVRLGGIVYVSSKDWTIWLNGKRVTPNALPKEALDLKVRERYVELKWFDEYTNQIFPLRLRPHQRFNIDTRIFLPG